MGLTVILRLVRIITGAFRIGWRFIMIRYVHYLRNRGIDTTLWCQTSCFLVKI
ncbi:unnamed protein product [Schistosoma mattheei]|uniref:Uncharacterized protein n=1 Tax=Schistosoma mattheei TaxID=31246 RepID=A0A3P8HHR4_9TREM|nr:unnamed protein product [Schistosoma mattheei]